MQSELLSAVIRVLPFILLIGILSIQISRGKISKDDIFIRKPKSQKYFLAWVYGFLFLILLTEITLYKYQLLETAPWNKPLIPSIIRITGAVLLAPVAEELFFRGILLFRLTSLNIHKQVSILIQAAIFVLLHNFTYENTLTSNIAVVQSFTDAMLYAYARYQTQSIYTPMAMHMTGNFIATLERFIL